MFVPFIGPLSTAACELAGATGARGLEERRVLLEEAETAWLEACEGVGMVLETAATEDEGAGAGVGVKYEVDRTVSASCVAIGSPFGLRNVIAGLTRVMTVFCIGSMTSAVSALTRCSAEGDGDVKVFERSVADVSADDKSTANVDA